MNNFKPLIFFIVLLFLCGCEQQADLKNTKKYKSNGISFTYPGNWSVTEDVEVEGFRYLSIETSGEAIIIINTYPKAEALLLKEYADQTFQELYNEMPIGHIKQDNISSIKKVLNTKAFNGFKIEYGASLLGINVPHTIEFFSVASESKVSYFYYQAANEDLNKVNDGFNLVLSSFRIQ